MWLNWAGPDLGRDRRGVVDTETGSYLRLTDFCIAQVCWAGPDPGRDRGTGRVVWYGRGIPAFG